MMFYCLLWYVQPSTPPVDGGEVISRVGRKAPAVRVFKLPVGTSCTGSLASRMSVRTIAPEAIDENCQRLSEKVDRAILVACTLRPSTYYAQQSQHFERKARFDSARKEACKLGCEKLIRFLDDFISSFQGRGSLKSLFNKSFLLEQSSICQQIVDACEAGDEGIPVLPVGIRYSLSDSIKVLESLAQTLLAVNTVEDFAKAVRAYNVVVSNINEQKEERRFDMQFLALRRREALLAFFAHQTWLEKWQHYKKFASEIFEKSESVLKTYDYPSAKKKLKTDTAQLTDKDECWQVVEGGHKVRISVENLTEYLQLLNCTTMQKLEQFTFNAGITAAAAQHIPASILNWQPTLPGVGDLDDLAGDLSSEYGNDNKSVIFET